MQIPEPESNAPLQPKTAFDLKVILMQRRKSLVSHIQQQQSLLLTLERDVAIKKSDVDALHGALNEVDKMLASMAAMTAPPGA